jgi:hypothetical protein
MTDNKGPSLTQLKDKQLESFIEIIEQATIVKSELVTVPQSWLKLLEQIEVRLKRPIIKQILTSGNMASNALAAEAVIDKTENFLQRAYQMLKWDTDNNDSGFPIYSKENIEHARRVSGASARMIGSIPEISLLPNAGPQNKRLPNALPNRRHEFITAMIPNEKHQKELEDLLATAEAKLRECINEAGTLTKANIDVLVADLLSIFKYCDNELRDIESMKETNKTLKELGASMEERIKELKRFNLSGRQKTLAQVYMQLETIFSSGLVEIAIPKSVIEVLVSRYSPAMLSEIRRDIGARRPQKGDLPAKRSMIEGLLTQALGKRRK